MRFVCFNANGIRARLHQIEAIAAIHQPDVIAIQETKVMDDVFPKEAIAALGFPHTYIYGQKSHYGVALLSRHALTDIQLGIPWREPDQQRRFIAATLPQEHGDIRIINGYYPQGESRDHPTKFPDKARFYADVKRYLEEHCHPDTHLIVAGDMNVAPTDDDIGIGADNAKRWLRTGKTSFLPEEREWLQDILQWGLVDSYSDTIDNRERLMSWFDYRSRGFERDPKRGLRIDLVLCTRPLAQQLINCGIDYSIRASDKPSDHCPIWCYFEGR